MNKPFTVIGIAFLSVGLGVTFSTIANKGFGLEGILNSAVGLAAMAIGAVILYEARKMKAD